MFEPEHGRCRLRCDFPDEETRRPERDERTLKVVDFVWLPTDTTWLVEIKDPERAEEPHRTPAVQDALTTLASGRLVDEHFLPKLFGTYVWLRREGLLRPLPHRYAILVAMASFDAPLRNAVTDRIQREIDAVGPFDRSTGRAPVTAVHSLASWNALAETPEIAREA